MFNEHITISFKSLVFAEWASTASCTMCMRVRSLRTMVWQLEKRERTTKCRRNKKRLTMSTASCKGIEHGKHDADRSLCALCVSEMCMGTHVKISINTCSRISVADKHRQPHTTTMFIPFALSLALSLGSLRTEQKNKWNNYHMLYFSWHFST